jgi:Fe-S cluster assembly iron-binding protein IscA
MVRNWSVAIAITVLSFVGCSSDPPAPRQRTNEPQVQTVDRKPALADAGVQITPAAKAEIARVSGQPTGTQVRLEFTPEGCTGMKTHLDIQLDPIRPQDSIQDCGGLYCVFLTEQFPLVQGALIDWKAKERGFAVTFPNKTRENQVKTTKWINDEIEKRAKRLDDEDRASGRIAERIAQTRKLTVDDPQNELGHFRLGQLLMVDRQHAEAVKSFERTLSISPDFSKATQLLGECLIKTGQKERAIEVLSKGWTTADKRGDEAPRDAMAAMLSSLGAPIPQGVSNKK